MNEETIEDVSLLLKACEEAEDKLNQNNISEKPNEVACKPSDICSLTLLCDTEIEERHKTLKARFEKNKEVIRKLKLVKQHKKKNELATLDQLIDKWRRASKEALVELLHHSTMQPPPTMLQLIHHLSIDPELLCFNTSTGEFVMSAEETTATSE